MKGAQLVKDKVTGQLKPVMTPNITSTGSPPLSSYGDSFKDGNTGTTKSDFDFPEDLKDPFKDMKHS